MSNLVGNTEIRVSRDEAQFIVARAANIIPKTGVKTGVFTNKIVVLFAQDK